MAKKRNRIQKARLMVQMGLVGVTERDKDGRIKCALVPGTNGKQYHVIIRRHGGRLTTECRLDTAIGHKDCQGNWRTVCYHSLAVLILAAVEAEKNVAFCKNEDDALLLARIGGEIVKVFPFRNSERNLWMVITE